MSTDRFTVRVVATGLLLIAWSVVLGALWLAHDGTAVPDALIALGSAALGGGAALLARTGSESVTIANEPSDPVPVKESKK